VLALSFFALADLPIASALNLHLKGGSFVLSSRFARARGGAERRGESGRSFGPSSIFLFFDEFGGGV
jgi:hypothetical protein